MVSKGKEILKRVEELNKKKHDLTSVLNEIVSETRNDPYRIHEYEEAMYQLKELQLQASELVKLYQEIKMELARKITFEEIEKDYKTLRVEAKEALKRLRASNR